MSEMIRKWAARRQLVPEMNSFIDKLLHTGVGTEDVILIHRLKLDLEPDFEVRIRSLQTLLDLNYRPAITYAIRELMRACNQWSQRPESHIRSEFLLRILYKELPPDEWRDET
jgi:hypothetical protein